MLNSPLILISPRSQSVWVLPNLTKNLIAKCLGSPKPYKKLEKNT